jgi:hypothetical protein
MYAPTAKNINLMKYNYLPAIINAAQTSTNPQQAVIEANPAKIPLEASESDHFGPSISLLSYLV